MRMLSPLLPIRKLRHAEGEVTGQRAHDTFGSRARTISRFLKSYLRGY